MQEGNPDNWLDRAKSRAYARRLREDNSIFHMPCCCWCRSILPCKCETEFSTSYPLSNMALKNNVLLYDNVPFYQYEDCWPRDKLRAEVILFYAHMRAEKLQQQVDALEQQVKELKQTMSDFMDACEFVPDGPLANEILDRVEKRLKK